jgi:hypothetical protein
MTCPSYSHGPSYSHDLSLLLPLNSKWWNEFDPFGKLFSQLVNFCGAYLAVDTACAIVILVLAIVCWIFDKGVGRGKPIKRQSSAIVWNTGIFIGGGWLVFFGLPILFRYSGGNNSFCSCQK